ncbi:hypothetical protein GCM10009122_45990 [Fulvivirga kasyanovii]|uniref:Zf-HC2 domain-containing protein n=1 Tax=Fulvivirga kasyanovii TaxID=396812 RepID=A0ABW9RWS0_9BACT|nr:zf-HC2 domain-containing protein [Fulvivirga kasyanovii]MTI28658.1 zf-HC2 domain-containing protein [Fulvivirga kasyanovii]
MEKPLKITDELLLDYIDGLLSKEEAARVEKACDQPQVAFRLEELKKTDQLLLMTATLQTPSKNFSSKVMANLDKPIVKSINYSRKNGLIILILALLTVIAGSLYMTESMLTLDMFDTVELPQVGNVMEMPDVQLPDSVNLKIITDGLLFAVLILALLLLDKVVLRPFFKSRRTEMQY